MIESLRILLSAGFLGAILAFFAIAVVMCMPIVFIWAVNGLAKSGGASFSLEYSWSNYFFAFIFLGHVRGN